MQIILSNEKDFSNENKHHLINLFIILMYLIFLKTRSLKKKKKTKSFLIQKYGHIHGILRLTILQKQIEMKGL